MRMGWPRDAIERNHAANLSVTFGKGPRLELFAYPTGRQQEASLHPHVAFMVAPGDFLAGEKRLVEGGAVARIGRAHQWPSGITTLSDGSATMGGGGA